MMEQTPERTTTNNKIQMANTETNHIENGMEHLNSALFLVSDRMFELENSKSISGQSNMATVEYSILRQVQKYLGMHKDNMEGK